MRLHSCKQFYQWQKTKLQQIGLAAKYDKLQALHYLDMRGADLNKADSVFKNTPLMNAAMNWQIRVIQYLLERGVQPKLKDKYGFTAADKAELRELKSVSQILRDYEQKRQKGRKSLKFRQRPKLQLKYKLLKYYTQDHYRSILNPRSYLSCSVHPFTGVNTNQNDSSTQISYKNAELQINIFSNFKQFSSIDSFDIPT